MPDYTVDEIMGIYDQDMEDILGCGYDADEQAEAEARMDEWLRFQLNLLEMRNRALGV